MAQVPNMVYPHQRSGEYNADRFTGTSFSGSDFTGSSFTGVSHSGSTFTGSKVYVNSSTQSGSAVTIQGAIIMQGFTANGAISAGAIVVTGSLLGQLSGASQSGMVPIGVAEADAVAGGALNVIIYGLCTMRFSGAEDIAIGAPVGTSVTGADYVAAEADAGYILGIAMYTGSNLSTWGTVLVSPR